MNENQQNRLTRTDWIVLFVAVIAHAALLAFFLRWLKRQ